MHKISNKIRIKAKMMIYIKIQVFLEPFSPVLLLVFAIKILSPVFFKEISTIRYMQESC